jgi:hypothetical protein
MRSQKWQQILRKFWQRWRQNMDKLRCMHEVLFMRLEMGGDFYCLAVIKFKLAWLSILAVKIIFFYFFERLNTRNFLQRFGGIKNFFMAC